MLNMMLEHNVPGFSHLDSNSVRQPNDNVTAATLYVFSRRKKTKIHPNTHDNSAAVWNKNT